MLRAFYSGTARCRNDDFSGGMMSISKQRIRSVFIACSASLTIAACGGGHDTNANAPAANSSITPGVSTTSTVPTADTVATGHHSKLAGAAVGAVAGHMLGGHAMAGAAVGAIVQHERNKRRN
jgi:hypothetical protein